jgi:hypothetical protein
MTMQTFREKILAMLHGDVVESLPFSIGGDTVRSGGLNGNAEIEGWESVGFVHPIQQYYTMSNER